ncbi:type II toxin-antitoxin system Phd/YefM family antitoxin [Candidatus Merdisoma sp. JLR.KK011]|uniref:type II toxin-antitoxin system Phd/YefM family antitoxin n=1 Tax=Candidatus Merdisoma sp. JLR.KK011 TaxID=3114299 RepID=UPI002FF3108B
MTIDTAAMISITEANQNFSRVTKLVDEHGTAVILKNNVPRYLVVDFSRAEKEKTADTEDVLAISERLIRQNMEAYEVLAK